jgi:hypothetical protein
MYVYAVWFTVMHVSSLLTAKPVALTNPPLQAIQNLALSVSTNPKFGPFNCTQLLQYYLF